MVLSSSTQTSSELHGERVEVHTVGPPHPEIPTQQVWSTARDSAFPVSSQVTLKRPVLRARSGGLVTRKALAGHISSLCLDFLCKWRTAWVPCFSDDQEAECDTCGFER